MYRLQSWAGHGNRSPSPPPRSLFSWWSRESTSVGSPLGVKWNRLAV